MLPGSSRESEKLIVCAYGVTSEASIPAAIPEMVTGVELVPAGMITLEATGSASANGKTYEGLRVSTSDLEIDLLLDANHKLMRLEVPSAKVSVVRD